MAGSACAVATALLPPGVARAQDGVAAVESLGGGLTVIAGLGGNVVALTTADGAVVVDSGAAQHTEMLTRELARITDGADVAALFNTHWHLDQVGGNAALRAPATRVIAHAKTLAHVSTRYYLPDEDRYQPPLATEAWPTERFYSDGALATGGERIEYGYLLEAHTDGDIFVRFADRNLIAAGDAISPERDPVFDWYGGGWIGGRIDSLERLLALGDSETRYVPSYGPVVGRGYVEAEHALMLALYDILFERVRAGESARDILASGALDSLPRRFDDPYRLLYDVHKSVWAHYNTISPDIV